jgi:hypothetical protein
MLSIFANATNLSSQAEDGKEIYLEANCQSCHGIDEQYDAKQNTVKDHFRLKKWVSSCMTYFNHSWFDDEQEAVLVYLNEIKYKVKLEK